MINYYLITKPGIVLGNLVTVAAGFLLASRGFFDLSLFFGTMLGLALIMASACVFNNLIDRPLDQKMERTKKRALVTGLISGKNALYYAIVLGIGGFLTLYAFTNLLTVVVALFGFFDYVVLYSFWKGKTIYGTAIGSLAGAVPPVIGYTAVTNRFDLGAIILFTMMVLWQMPHFFAIALYRFKDYSAAKIPVLPIIKGSFRTKIHMTIYIALFMAASLLLNYFNYTGDLFFWTTLLLGSIWFLLSLKGFFETDDVKWGKEMFQYSLVLITLMSIALPF